MIWLGINDLVFDFFSLVTRYKDLHNRNNEIHYEKDEMKTISYGGIIVMLSVVIIIACCNKQNQNTINIVDNAESIEVLFEEVAKNIKIIPLEANEPLDEIADVKSFGEMLLIRNRAQSVLYVFDKGKFLSKLSAQGRGRGEYDEISSFTYCEKDHILYVSTYGMSNNPGTVGLGSTVTDILKYSVPDMNYLGKISIEGNVTNILLHDDKTLIGTVTRAKGITISLISIEDGSIIKDITPLSSYGFMNLDKCMKSYTSHSHIMPIMDYINTIGVVTPTGEFKPVFRFSFGEKSIPQKLMAFDNSDIMALVDVATYIGEHKETTLEGNYFARVDGNRISFWYKCVWDNTNMMYYSYENGVIVNQKGFCVPGILKSFTPNFITETGYGVILESGWDAGIENPSSELIRELRNKTLNDGNNNPLIVCYELE